MSVGKIGSITNNSASVYSASSVIPARAATGVSVNAEVSSIEAVTPVKAADDLTASPVRAPSVQDVGEAVQQIRDYVKMVAPELDFSVDDETGRFVIKVMDTTTDEMVRQIPVEEILHIARMLDKLRGLLYNDKA